jgi:hypothetical protein
MVSAADKLADDVLLWEKNIVPYLISSSREPGKYSALSA